MDDMLVRGATRTELASSGRDPVNQLYHLRRDHGLQISEDTHGVLRYDRAALGIDVGSAVDEVDAETQAGLFGSGETNPEVERAAVRYVTAKLEADGWSVTSAEREGCGYDLRCQRGTDELHVEVKGRSGHGTQFVLTHGEFRQARDNPRFVLMLVSKALGDSPVLEQFDGPTLLRSFTIVPLQYVARRSAT
jgi:hypothetical protein